MESEQIAVTETTSEASEPSSAEAPAGLASRYLKRQVVCERDPDLLCTLSMRTLPAWMLDVSRHLGLYVADAHKNNLGFPLTALGSIWTEYVGKMQRDNRQRAPGHSQLAIPTSDRLGVTQIRSFSSSWTFLFLARDIIRHLKYSSSTEYGGSLHG